LRVLPTEHYFINPVLYIEYQNLSPTDKIIKEVERRRGFPPPNVVLRQIPDRELEFKIILSKDRRGWNFAFNPITSKNLSPSDPWEFGYAAGASRPLTLKASAGRCNPCPENFIVGVEIYGGTGTINTFGLQQTSH
jgi:hypothetical protein